MKLRNWKAGVEFIALNDSLGDGDCLDIKAVSSLVTVALLSEMFDVSTRTIAKEVVRVRKEYFLSKTKTKT